MQRKLALYSDQEIPENRAMDEHLLRLIGCERPRIGYIPPSPEPDRGYFNYKRAYYDQMGATLVYVEPDADYSESELNDLLACDAIHLSGGNTYSFIKWLKQRNMLAPLRDYVAGGGVLIGVSAGSILMTPDVQTASLCGDEPGNTRIDEPALGIVDFRFWPHYNPAIKPDLALAAPSRLYACPDGAGLIVDGDEIVVYGPVKIIDLPGGNARVE